MTDTTAAFTLPRVIDVTSSEAVARVRRRYAAEARFRFLGLAAIGFAAFFLVFLLADIVVKAIPAFTASVVALDVPLDAQAIDPGGSRRPAEIARGDFAKPVREALYALFPRVSDRKQRRSLSGLLSAGGPDDLRQAVLADPSLIGEKLSIPVLLSDDADLYLKGIAAERRVLEGRGSAGLNATTGPVELFASSNSFAAIVADVKAAVADRAQALRSEHTRLAGDLEGARGRLREASDAAAKAKAGGNAVEAATLEAAAGKLKSDMAALETSVADLEGRAASLEARGAKIGSAMELDADLPSILVRINDGIVKASAVGSDRIVGEVLVPLASAAEAAGGAWQILLIDTPESSRKLQDQEVAFLEMLREKGVTGRELNWRFFTTGDSREAELAGIFGALVGSALTMLVTLLFCLPVGVAAAVYLEEFAPKNRLTDLIEVSINNLAAVPSIVFGLLGLAIFLNVFGLPRSSSLVGGLVLALLVLPTIIIASRAALKAVPPSIREAALGIGASRQQAVFHHVLPLAMPGVMTGTIIGMAHALGETAPLLMIGMIAFIVDPPAGVADAATVLPVQIFLWSDLPEVGFQAKTAAAIIVLLMFLFLMNGLAILLRRRFERRW